MSDAEKNDNDIDNLDVEIVEDGESSSDDKKKSSSKGGGLMSYIIIGAIALVCIAVGVFAGLMLMGDDKPEQTAEDTKEVHADSTSKEHIADKGESHNKPDSHDNIDSLFLDEMDQSVIDMIEENLAVLDWNPDIEMPEDGLGMSVEDSVEEVNWIESEKKKLADIDSDLKRREKELIKLDKSVTKKILRIEQEESSRISKLAKLYDGMDSRSVAKLFVNLDDETVVMILPKMKTKNASAVLQLLPPQRAARLSKKMITIAEI